MLRIDFLKPEDPAPVFPTKNPNPTGTKLAIFTQLTPGMCSLMGYNWENQAKLISTMKWSKNPRLYSGLVQQLMTEFSKLGKMALARSSPQCNMEKAGVVPCKILYFPHAEHRCQLIQRLNRVYLGVARYIKKSAKNLLQLWLSKKYVILTHTLASDLCAEQMP